MSTFLWATSYLQKIEMSFQKSPYRRKITQSGHPGPDRKDRDKHSSSLQTLVNYNRKKFHNFAPRLQLFSQNLDFTVVFTDGSNKLDCLTLA